MIIMMDPSVLPMIIQMIYHAIPYCCGVLGDKCLCAIAILIVNHPFKITDINNGHHLQSLSLVEAFKFGALKSKVPRRWMEG